MHPYVKLAAEGVVDVAVCRRLVRETGMIADEEFGLRGKDHLDKRLRGYNMAAKLSPWIIARDLDHDAECPGLLSATLLPRPAAYMRFRIVVRSIEAWVVADRVAFAEEFSIDPQWVPRSPESLENPKNDVLGLLLRSASRDVRAGMVLARKGHPTRIGPEYNSMMSDFVDRKWRPTIAAGEAPSLARAILRIKELEHKARQNAKGSSR